MPAALIMNTATDGAGHPMSAALITGQQGRRSIYRDRCLVIGMFNDQFRFSEKLMYGKKFAKITIVENLQWPVCNYLLCNTKDSSRCN